MTKKIQFTYTKAKVRKLYNIMNIMNIQLTGLVWITQYVEQPSVRCVKKLINRNDLIIGKLVPFKSKHIKQFYHVDCAFKSFEKAKTPTDRISDPSELYGLMLIDSTGKVRINDLLRNVPFPKLSSAALIKTRESKSLPPSLGIERS